MTDGYYQTKIYPGPQGLLVSQSNLAKSGTLKPVAGPRKFRPSN